jgi:hypothetical protein
VLMASIDDVKGRTVAYSRSNAYVSSTSRITSIVAVLLRGAVLVLQVLVVVDTRI